MSYSTGSTGGGGSAGGDENPRYVIAIDFGTSRSGFAFGDFRAPERVSTYDHFPGTQAGQKTRTDLLLNDDLTFRMFGDAAANEFTQMEGSGEQELLFFSQFKMALFCKEQLKIRPYIQSSNKPGRGAPAVLLIEHSLRFMADLALEYASSKSVEGGAVTMQDVLWVITVPAIWSDGSKQIMKEAAVAAGLIPSKHSPRLMFALEPEAAAMWCRQWLEKEQQVTMSKGDQYMLLDCGGGTVDSIVHEVLASGGVREIEEAGGGPWGSQFINSAFEKFIEELIGSEAYRQFKQEYPNEHYQMMDRFDLRVKHAMKGRSQWPRDSAPTVLFNLPPELRDVMEELDCDSLQDLCEEYSSMNSLPVQIPTGRNKFGLVLPLELVYSFFDSCIDNIAEHARQLKQAQPKVKYFLLVGGFAGSPVLVEALKKCGLDPKSPYHPALAVVGGACLQGLNAVIRGLHVDRPRIVAAATVEQRILARTYGCGVAKAWTPEDEEAGQFRFSELNERSGQLEHFCSVFRVFVKRGDAVPFDETHTHSFQPLGTSGKVTFRILTTKKQTTNYADAPDVSTAGQVTLTLPPKPGVLFRDRSLKLHLTFGAGDIRVRAEETDTGAQVEADIDFLG